MVTSANSSIVALAAAALRSGELSINDDETNTIESSGSLITVDPDSLEIVDFQHDDVEYSLTDDQAQTVLDAISPALMGREEQEYYRNIGAA